MSQAERGDDDDESEHSESQGDQSSSQPNQVPHTAAYSAIILSHDGLSCAIVLIQILSNFGNINLI